MKNFLMKHLIDIVINQGFKKIKIFQNLTNNILYLNTLNHIFTSKFRIKSIKKC